MAGFGRSRKWLLYITLFALLAVFGIYSGYTPQSVKMSAGFYSVRENVPEIYGLFDLVLPTVTKHEQLLPSKHSSLLVDGPLTGASPNLERGIYDLGANPVDWKLRREEIDHDYPIIVFGKSYCPFTKRLESLLDSLPLDPKPYIVQADLRADTTLMQGLLQRLTGRRTVPNMVVHGVSIGGSDDVHALYQKSGNVYGAGTEGGKLREILEEAGVSWKPKAATPQILHEYEDREEEKRWIAKQES